MAAELLPNPESLLPLRDLHLPEPPGFWPLAPGWWLILTGLLAVLVMCWWLLKRQRHLRYRRTALRLLEELERQQLADHELLGQLSSLLRRAALTAFPASGCAGLQGLLWLRFLDDHHDGTAAFCSGPGQSLAAGPYQRQPQYDRLALCALCRHWLQQLPPQPRSGRLR